MPWGLVHIGDGVRRDAVQNERGSHKAFGHQANREESLITALDL